MAYTPTNWKCGDTITADKMNHIEEGIENAGGSAFEVHAGSNNTLDKTWQEIYDAMPNAYIGSEESGKMCILGAVAMQNNYFILTFNPTQSDVQMMVFLTDSASGYPVLRSNS